MYVHVSFICNSRAYKFFYFLRNNFCSLSGFKHIWTALSLRCLFAALFCLRYPVSCGSCFYFSYCSFFLLISMKHLVSTSWLAAGLGSLVAFTAAQPLAPPPSQPSLQFLLGKRVTSVVQLKKTEASPAAAMQGAVAMAGPSEQSITRVLAVKKGKTTEELLVEQAIKRVQLTIVSPLGRSVYDSENAFERDAVTSALGQRYDPYIDKPRTGSYRPGGPAATLLATDASFESIWTTNVPALGRNALLQGILLAPLPATLAQGSQWTDSVRTGATMTVNQYQVLKKEGDLLQVSLASRLAAGQQRGQASGAAGTGVQVSATSTVSTLEYNGELRVRQASGFIEELHLTKHSAAVVKAGGQSLPNDSYAKVDIVNTIK
jgi:hypothetical protein